MALPSTVKGARHTGLSITWTKRESGTAQDLTSSAVTGVIRSKDGTSTAITGTLTLVTPASGIFSWSFSAADVATAGTFEVQFKATYGDSTFDYSFPERWVVEDTLSV